MKAPGLGESQRTILAVLKRRGTASIPDLAQTLDLNIETVRDHLKRLAARGLVRRHASRRNGPGRPVILFALTAEAGSLFPSREGELLRDLALHLRVCHCPIRELVGVTRLPCLAEIGFLRELVGEAMTRESYMPSGDAACSYRIGSRC